MLNQLSHPGAPPLDFITFFTKETKTSFADLLKCNENEYMLYGKELCAVASVAIRG